MTAWARRKMNVVRRFHASSYLVGRRMAGTGETLDADWGVDPADYAAHGGAFPIRIADVGVVGIVAVSRVSRRPTTTRWSSPRWPT